MPNTVSFDQLTNMLATHLIEAAGAFAASNNLPRLDTDALSNMSAHLRDVAQEVLMFGCDTWPEEIRRAESAVRP